ncbi:hypothetical protein LB507_003263, partial [Fusarium sp. FIESC RH6]
RLHCFRLITKSRFFPPPPSRPVFSSSTFRPHFNNNAAFCERRFSFFLLPTSSFLFYIRHSSCSSHLPILSDSSRRFSSPLLPFLSDTNILLLYTRPNRRIKEPDGSGSNIRLSY